MAVTFISSLGAAVGSLFGRAAVGAAAGILVMVMVFAYWIYILVNR
jgi:hypothetical protein